MELTNALARLDVLVKLHAVNRSAMHRTHPAVNRELALPCLCVGAQRRPHAARGRYAPMGIIARSKPPNLSPISLKAGHVGRPSSVGALRGTGRR